MRPTVPPPRYPVVASARIFGPVKPVLGFYMLCVDEDFGGRFAFLVRDFDDVLDESQRWPRGGRVFAFGGDPSDPPVLWEMVRWLDGRSVWLRPEHKPPRGGNKGNAHAPGSVGDGRSYA